MSGRTGDTPRDAFDPVDYDRACIRDHALDLARFADMVATLADMRKDDRAHAMFGAVLDEIAALKLHFTSLARSLRQETPADLEAMRSRANIAMEEANRRRQGADAVAS